MLSSHRRCGAPAGSGARQQPISAAATRSSSLRRAALVVPVQAFVAAQAPAASTPSTSSSFSAAPTSVDWHLQKLKHVVDSAQFNRAAVDVVFGEALKMEKVRPGTPESKSLEGFIMSTLFYEPSTRTRLSFESAMSRLGGTVLSTESAGEYSSAAKGETLEGAASCCAHGGGSGPWGEESAGSPGGGGSPASVPSCDMLLGSSACTPRRGRLALAPGLPKLHVCIPLPTAAEAPTTLLCRTPVRNAAPPTHPSCVAGNSR